MPVSFHSADHTHRCPHKRLIKKWLGQVVSHENKILGGLSIVFCSDAYLLKINQDYLEHDYYTDIITFDYSENQEVHGELYISVDRVKDNSKSHNSLFFNELCRVMVHGVLHLLGYKDKTDKEKITMRALEDSWLNSLNNTLSDA